VADRDPHKTTAFFLLRYTAQRPSDVLAMARSHYNGDAIRVRSRPMSVQIASTSRSAA
jgi:hypothetical protein